jgi:hypothetical protein
MAGQSAHLSLKEARAMQERVQHSGSQAKSGGSVRTSGGDSVHRKMKACKSCGNSPCTC